MIQPVGYFKTWRELFTKPIWLKSSPEQKAILMTLLAMANFKPKQWEWEGRKFEVSIGQFVTSANSIIECCGLGITRQNVRTALERFRKLDFLTYKTTKTGILVTIINWELYQSDNEEANQPLNQDLTNSQPRPNQDLTTREERKKDKKEKKVNNNIPFQSIIDYLNQKANKNYKHTSAKTQTLISARWNEGFKEQDFFKVIDNKVSVWLKNPNMNQYLRPETLFGTKFEGYLNEGETNGQNSGHNQQDTDGEYDFSKVMFNGDTSAADEEVDF